MKSIYNRLKTSFCLMTAFLLAVGCSEEYKYTTDYSFYDGVTLKMNLVDENNVLSVRLANKTHMLTIAVTPEDVFIDPKAYIYELEDNSIASVAQDGTITLLKAGKTTLSAKFRGNQEIAASCTLDVLPTFISELKVTATDVRVEEGKELDLAPFVAVIPSDADNQNLHYEVKAGSEDYVEIAEGSSIVKALSKGTATIVVSATDGSGVSTELTVEVTGKIPVSEIILGRAADLDGKTFAIGQVFDIGSALSVSPTNASDPTVVYELVSGDGVVTLDAENGIVTTIGTGDAEIKISAHDGFDEAEPQIIKFKVDGSQTWYEPVYWTVETTVVYSKNNATYVPDKTTGKPEHVIDGNGKTYLMMVKPDKANGYDGYLHPSGSEFGFIVDCGSELEFNQLKWIHRDTNAKFQAFKIKVSGSNDKTNYTVLEESLETKSSVAEIELPLSAMHKCRYIKVEFIEYESANSGGKGSNLCVAGFNVGKK